MRKNKNCLFRISICVSLALHVIAIACSNHMKIHSYLTTGNISFANKTKIPYKKKPSKELISLVLKQKQKDIQKMAETRQIISLPESETNKSPVNDFVRENEPAQKTIFAFHLPTLTIHGSANENKNFEIQPQNLNDSSGFFEFQDSPGLSNPEESSSDQMDPDREYLLSLNETSLREFKIEKQTLSIPFFGLANEEKKALIETMENPALPKSEKEKKCSLGEVKEFQTKIADLFKFKEYLKNEEFLVENLIKIKKKEITLFNQSHFLIDLPRLNELATLPYKDYFDIEVIFSPLINERGYVFAITFIPKTTIKLSRLKQNIFFLVDRSNSIQKDRLTNTRHAITSSLPFLNEEDTFNILAFDTKLDVLSAINLKNDNISVSRARGFLRNQNIGSFFSSTNFSIPLYKILDKNVKDDEINVAVLLSNGDGLNKFKNNRVLNDWTKLNKGNLSLYTLCLGNDKNMAVLELFSSLNKGKLLFSDSAKGIKRKLQRLLKSISSPIAKDIAANVICLDNKANIKLYPPAGKSPNLYIDEPYTILGTTEKLQDFTIFLQGKCKNNTFNLKKHVHFDKAKQGGTALQRELALKQAAICYEKYLADNNPTHLKEAKNRLKPFDIQPIFQ